MIEKIFKLKQHKTNVKIEVIAGITTFMTMAYILAVNPDILSNAGMNIGAVFTATAIAAAVGTLIMAFLANLPIGLAPGMGLNAFFAFTVVIAMGNSWQFALTAVFLEGIIFIVLTAFKLRNAIVDSIPHSMKNAISCGIGLFIAFIGLVNAGIIKTGMSIAADGKTLSGLPLALGSINSPEAIVALIGIAIGGILLCRKVKGAILLSILIATVVGIPFGVTHIQNFNNFFSLPPSIKPIFFQFQFNHIFSTQMLITIITLLFMDLFDTIGTLIGVATKAGLIDKNGNMPKMKEALFADAIGTTFGAILGTSTVTAYVESASGVAEGGKTGLTAFVVAILFLAALFISPVFLLIPSAATAPALILVGLFMLSPILEVDFNDYSESLPCFLTIIMMPFTYSIADGILFGIISYVIIKLFSGKIKHLNWFIVILAILFLLKLFFLQ
ncbi:MAG TPA: NCS2 family permease [Victivallales bacterium]|nr:NCS2 family permease [Victivallales bacterium]